MSIILDENGNEIKFKPVKYTLKQTAEEVEVASSTIRFWTKKFEEFLDMDNNSWKKEYTDRDVYVFKFIQKSIRVDKLTIEQTRELLNVRYEQVSKVGFDETENTKNDVALNKAIDNRLNDFKTDIVEEISSSIEEKLIDVLKKHFIGVEDMINKNNSSVAEKMEQIQSEAAVTIEDHANGINDTLDKMQESMKQRDLESTNLMRELLEQKKQEFELRYQSEEKKGFLARIFSK